MDYTWDGIKGGGTSPYEKGKYMPILRNHRYIFTIKEVKGPGFATLNEAVTGHALISDALYLGLERTIQEYKNCLRS